MNKEIKTSPIILHLETTAKNCSVCITKGNEILCLCEEFEDKYSHSEKLHLFIQWALEGAEITIQEIDAVSVSKGPGSYTGLRIGVSAAKGLCYTLGVSLIAINTLNSMVQTSLENTYDFYICCIDARRMEIFSKTFDSAKKPVSGTINEIITLEYFTDKLNKKIAFLGDGCYKIKELYETLSLEKQKFDFYPEIYPTSKNLINLALQKYYVKDFEDVAYFEPFYLKPVHINIKK